MGRSTPPGHSTQPHPIYIFFFIYILLFFILLFYIYTSWNTRSRTGSVKWQVPVGSRAHVKSVYKCDPFFGLNFCNKNWNQNLVAALYTDCFNTFLAHLYTDCFPSIYCPFIIIEVRNILYNYRIPSSKIRHLGVKIYILLAPPYIKILCEIYYLARFFVNHRPVFAF